MWNADLAGRPEQTRLECVLSIASRFILPPQHGPNPNNGVH